MPGLATARPLVSLTVVVTLTAGFLGVDAGPVLADDSVEPGRIAYSSDDGEGVQFAIWVADPDGGPPVDLTSGLGVDAFRPIWSPDGLVIAFSNHGEIWLIGADGANAMNVTNSPDSDEWYPEWSPDGSKLSYLAGTGGLWVVDSDGGNPVEIANYASLQGDGTTTWSPDGSSIAHEAWTGTMTADVWVVDVASGGHVNLTRSPESLNVEPDWSPDGSQIAFVSNRSGRSGVWVMDADGGGPVELAASSTQVVQMMNPTWSPDAQRIAFVSDGDVWVMDADGSDAVNLTNTPELVEYQLVWSSDGSALAFASSPDGWDIWVVDLESGAATNLTDTPDTQEWSPSWQPVFPPTGMVDTDTGVWHLRAGGRAADFYYGDPGDEPFLGDWDCDGVETPGLFRRSDAFVYLRNANTQGIADIRFFFGNPSDIPLAGDFDGDGCDTVAIYRPSEQRIFVINQLGANEGGLGAAEYSFLFGNPGDKPVAGDWDGDGIDEIGLHRESSGFFYYRETLTTGGADGQFYFGSPGDRFVAGDWGIVDGVETPGVFRPENNMFYLRHTLSQGLADSQFPYPNAGPQWYPVAGRFDLD